MPPEPLDWKTMDWGKVYRRSHRPIELRGFSDPYITTRVVGLLLILLCALIFPKLHISWNWSSVLIYLAAFT